jgi:hypothetical protein
MCKDGQVFSSARDGNSCLRSGPLPLLDRADEVIE